MNSSPERAAVQQAYARGQLEAPVSALREYSRMLARPEADSPLADDFAKLTRFAEELHTQVRGVLDSLGSPMEPAELRKVRHDLRGQAGRIVTLCDILVDDEADTLPAGMLDELRTIRDVSRRVIEQINTVLSTDTGKPQEAPDLEGVLRTIAAGRRDQTIEPGRILLVDDTPDNRDLLARLLVKWGGHEITAVENGEAALTALERSPFDVVLLDVMMPGLSGFEVLQLIRDSHQWRYLPVILMSALGEEEAVIAGIGAGADDYVRRPFNPALLVARINACLDRKRFRDRELEYQQQIDKLIQALFPPEVADEVRLNGTIPPRRYDDVGVLFLDVVGFTPWCEARRDQPERVADALQTLVACLEEVAHEHGVQKIKTIGDAFLGTTGLTRPDPDPVGTLVRCAQDMIGAVKRSAEGWQVRIGIHVGPVMAGVIGTTQFQFDVFGDTVNRASRLQSLAHPGGIVLSETAWSAVAGRVAGSSREEDVRGVGRITIWDLT